MMPGETGGGCPLVSSEMEMNNMEIALMLMALMALSMAKKKETRKFGQMTLNMGGQALEYLKTSVKPITRNVQRVEWANKIYFEDRYELPPWVLPKSDDDRAQFKGSDRVQEVAILHDADPAEIPLLVYQVTALRGLDHALAKAQEDGALVKDDGRLLVLDMGEESLKMSFLRNPKGGKFAPFIVTLND